MRKQSFTGESNLLCIAASLVILHVFPCEGKYCPDIHSNDTDLAWTFEPPAEVYGCIAEYSELDCCVTGYDQITWYQKQTDQHDFHPMTTQFDKKLSEKNQTVMITDTEEWRDAGMYKCLATQASSGETIHRTMKLIVYDCSNYNEAPLVLLPATNGSLAPQELNTDGQLECMAFYGNCGQSAKCEMTWWRVLENGTKHAILETNSSMRIYVTELRTKLQLSGKTKVLHIDNVTRGDYGLYECEMTSNYGKSTREVNLTQEIPPEPPRKDNTPQITVSTVVPVSVIIIVAVTSYVCISNWKRIREKRRKIPEGDRAYDVVVVSVQEDSELNSEICDYLTRTRKLSVYDCTQIREGHDHFEKFSTEFENSKCVIFLVTSSFIQDPACIYLFGLTDKDQSIYRVFVNCLSNSEVQESLKSRPNVDSESDENVSKQRIDGVKTLIKVMKVCRSVKWNNDNTQGSLESLDAYLPKHQPRSDNECRNNQEQSEEVSIDINENEGLLRQKSKI